MILCYLGRCHDDRDATAAFGEVTKVREKLTLSLLTRSFTHLLGNMVNVKFSDEKGPLSGTTQSYSDIAILPEHLYKTIDDVAEELLLPAAGALAERMKENRAFISFEMDGPRAPYQDIECSIHRYNGCSVRGMVQRGIETNGPDGGLLVFDAFRFDVLYRSEMVQ